MNRNRLDLYFKDYPPTWRPSDPRCDAGRDVEPAGARHGLAHGLERGRPFPGLTWQQSLVWVLAIWAFYLLATA